jgi:hypothetical protein
LGSSEIRGTSVAIQKLFEEFEDVFREELLACSMPHLSIIAMESLSQKGLIQPTRAVPYTLKTEILVRKENRLKVLNS